MEAPALGVHGMSVVTAVTAQRGSPTDGGRVESEDDLRRAADAVLEYGPRWVLIKGGHLPGDAVDLLTDGSVECRRHAPRHDNRHTHGTGCTLAAAIASGLAKGLSIPDAVTEAKEYVTGAIAAGFALGSGIGPVDHGWRLRAQGAGTAKSRPTMR